MHYQAFKTGMGSFGELEPVPPFLQYFNAKYM